MTQEEHLLTILAEECSEVAQRVTKALRFGLSEVQPGQSFTNAERIREEYADLMATYDLLVGKGMLKLPDYKQLLEKQDKISKFLEYSKQCGTLSD